MGTAKWYVVHTLTGAETKAKANLETRADMAGMRHLIQQVMIPTEKVSEVKAGRKRISERKFFPGYLLVQMELNEDSWYLVKNTPGISGFVGSGKTPLPLTENDVGQILQQQEEKTSKPKPKVEFIPGENVRVKEGSFANFNGVIEEINPNRGKLKVMVTIFGRSTPVELEYWQVEKI
ncbi:MAG: transcription termination/antitermination protein NusG [Candidatus Omnitrophica bacterium]|nr:transcription termination/antitermination protein NusG [Candidatus Omnitrophota bacterium]MDD5670225.1 transcription termination/antitermination protein NusG [Candidatus Omnitrophota bacterium]